MTLNEARITAVNNSLANGGAVQHITATIYHMLPTDGQDRYAISPGGYTVTNWSSDATVESYCGQKRTYQL